ncbi:nitroreductase family deazaflavin-dependent oxidoreductase [Nocardia transvalensis]|uniref:nitroreductase family deazaflavin-dependent oxidoreductase n=1 Tax=Nocardia transvalensis TaxID=37333 RepID=UPI001895F6A6|nr:nitroreductase family deazaflavin-dependent oxidoreductase [Nocardia transvalensis]MBF6333056.1 nitroreductase family deazaflavin-dependent oxidoreductase [Nocardia transvalensis]
MSTTNATVSLAARALRTRWVVRAPIRLYRWGFGFLFGNRMLMLEHRGRRSGLPRYVVLEVVDRPAPDEYIIVSGFGPRSQWYRNVRADPRVRVWTGLRRGVRASATLLSEAESAAALDHYAQHHPRLWKRLRATVEQATGAPVGTLPMVRLRLDA